MDDIYTKKPEECAYSFTPGSYIHLSLLHN